MYVSSESPRQTHERLLKVIAAAELRILPGTYAFEEFPLGDLQLCLSSDALAIVRDDEVWSQLVPSSDSSRELFSVFRFHFQDGLDNSGFVGWLASHLKARLGTGLFVICGQNSRHGGIFDYWGCPAALSDRVLAEIRPLRGETLDGAIDPLDGKRMRAVATDAVGEVDTRTLFEFTQRRDRVSARYAGGKVRRGYLAGTLQGDTLEYRYAQVDEAGDVHGGRSICDVTLNDDGRVRLTEHFQWDTRPGGGVNVIEETTA